MSPTVTPAPLADAFGRQITYLRVSVTDRCDLRCTYCMPERMTFLPKSDVLTFEELARLISIFVRRGVRKVRLSGGEPLMRKGVMSFIGGLSGHLTAGALDELALTTNGTRLSQYSEELCAAGVRRINVSLDTLDRETFQRISRRDQLDLVLAGIEAALSAGLRVKLNTVVLRRDNREEIPKLVSWAHARGMDITLIETMPLGDIEQDRTEQFVSLASVRAELESFWRLEDISYSTGGPSRYVRVRETGGRLGFITPLSHNFCAGCNRVRLTCTGRLYLCLGREDHLDFRSAMRDGADDRELSALLDAALRTKPEAHDFRIDGPGAAPAAPRHMSVTGG